jgi:hypothetical protein
MSKQQPRIIISAHPIIAKPDEQQVYKVLLKMLDRWNAHDIKAYMGFIGSLLSC